MVVVQSLVASRHVLLSRPCVFSTIVRRQDEFPTIVVIGGSFNEAEPAAAPLSARRIVVVDVTFTNAFHIVVRLTKYGYI